MGTYRCMRASDQDRQEAAARLGDAFVEGRLTRDELDERCAAAYAAKTWGELADLTADLPIVQMEVSPLSGTVAPHRMRRLDNQQPFWPPLLAYALVLGAILGSLAQSLVVWTAAALIPLALVLPLALGSARRRRHR